MALVNEPFQPGLGNGGGERLARAADLLSEHDISFRPSRATAGMPSARDVGVDEKRLAARAANIYRGRRLRDKLFKDLNLFSEPAWDIMLDLFVAAAEERAISVSSAAIASSVALSTGLRWIDTLMARGLIERLSDPTDRRRTFVRLTERGHMLVTQAVEASDGAAWGG